MERIMTQHRDLKTLIRERMAKTGERYTAARANILHEHPSPTSPKKNEPLFPGYPLRPGICGDTGVLRNALEQAGLRSAHNKQPLSEAMVAGLCGGICFLYIVFEYKGMPPMLSVLPRYDTMSDSFIAGGVNRLGAAAADSATSSASVARKALDAALAAKSPALCVVDCFGMIPGFGPMCMSGMAPTVVCVCGVDGDELLVDCGVGTIRRMSHEEFAKVRGMYKKGKHRLITITPDLGTVDLKPAVLSSIKDTATRFIESPYKGFASNFGIAGMEKFQHMLTDPKDKKGWPQLFAEGPAAYLGLHRLHDGIMHEYISPGAGRPLYAEFLREAAAVTGHKQLTKAADAYDASGKLWLRIADMIATCGDPAIEAGCKQGDSAMELFAECGNPGAPPKTPVNPERVSTMRSCTIPKTRAAALYGEIAKVVADVLLAEKKGLELLQGVGVG
jgi:hypothetical protein